MHKPTGMTSFSVVSRLRRWSGVKKIGHCGTLDPAASGLLILLTAQATRRQSRFMGLDKEYLARILLGVETDTWDRDGKIVAEQPVPNIGRGDIEKLMRERFQGEFDQNPPAYSAIKHEGIPNYRRARRGEAVPTRARRVTVLETEVMDFSPPDIGLRIVCSSGFYVRSLAHDIGASLGCGAMLNGLIRTRIGDHRLDDAWSLEDLERILTTSELSRATCPN